MSKFLIHIHSGPELKNKATLGMLVAITAHKKVMNLTFFGCRWNTFVKHKK